MKIDHETGKLFIRTEYLASKVNYSTNWKSHYVISIFIAISEGVCMQYVTLRHVNKTIKCYCMMACLYNAIFIFVTHKLILWDYIYIYVYIYILYIYIYIYIVIKPYFRYLLQTCSLHWVLALLVGVSNAGSLFIWPIGGCICLKLAFFPAEPLPSVDNDAWLSVDKLGSEPMIAPFFVFLDMFWFGRILFGPCDVELTIKNG